jgi:hypothetical protein
MGVATWHGRRPGSSAGNLKGGFSRSVLEF